MAIGYGTGAGVNLVTESAYGTHPGSGDVSVTFKSCSFKVNRPIIESASITGDRGIRRRQSGIFGVSGDLVHEVDGAGLGQLFNYWNGNYTGAKTTAALSASKGMVTAAPTVTPSASGSLQDGDYIYKIASIWAHTASGRKLYLPAGSGNVAATAGSGDNTMGLSWSAPTGVPSGFTLHGYAVYRSTKNGAHTTARYLAFVAAGTTTYSDTGAVNNGGTTMTTSLYMGGAPYEHIFNKAFAPGTHPLPSFSATFLKDNDESERYVGCRFNTFGLNIAGGDAIVEASFGMIGREASSVANITPSLTHLKKFMSWQGVVSLDGTASDLFTAVTINGDNGCQPRQGLSGFPRIRNVGYGTRKITGTLARDFENHDLWDKMLAGTPFDISVAASGQAWDLTMSPILLSGSTYAYPMEYFMVVDVFNCLCGEAGADVSGEGPMSESIPFSAEVDDSEGTELRLRLYNLTSSYA